MSDVMAQAGSSVGWAGKRQCRALQRGLFQCPCEGCCSAVKDVGILGLGRGEEFNPGPVTKACLLKSFV